MGLWQSYREFQDLQCEYSCEIPFKIHSSLKLRLCNGHTLGAINVIKALKCVLTYVGCSSVCGVEPGWWKLQSIFDTLGTWGRREQGVNTLQPSTVGNEAPKSFHNHSRDLSWLKAATGTFTFKNLLRLNRHWVCCHEFGYWVANVCPLYFCIVIPISNLLTTYSGLTLV